MSGRVPSLPVEIIAQILEDADSPATLYNAALSSRQWYDIAVPYLYRRIDIDSRDRHPNGILKRFLLLFLRRPELAAHVRHFSIRPAWEDSRPGGRTTPLKQSLEEALSNAEDLEVEIRDAVARASHSDEEHVNWLEEIEVEDTTLALLLPLFTRLETLDLEYTFTSCVERMLQRAGQREKPFDSQPAFVSLHSLLWAHSDNKYGGEFAVGPFLFPSIQTVYLHRVGSGDDDAPDKNLACVGQGTSQCTHLELKDCRLNVGDTKTLLSIPKRLKTFIYEVSGGHLSYCSVSFPALRDALEVHKDTLEDLWIDIVHDGILWVEEMDDTLPFTSLQNFSRLRRLRIAPDFVFGTQSEGVDRRHDRNKRLLDLLPPSIEVLHITHGDEYGIMLDGFRAEDNLSTVYDGLELVLSNKSALPLLQKIILDTSLPTIRKQPHGSRLTSLQQTARSIDVQFLLRDNHGDKKFEDYQARIERKWGMDAIVEWKPCGSLLNSVPIYESIELQQLQQSNYRGISVN